VVIHQQFLIVAVPRQQMRVSQVLEQHDAAVAYPKSKLCMARPFPERAWGHNLGSTGRRDKRKNDSDRPVGIAVPYAHFP
jgi:hypothetical protein